jgi:hypothetical protein
MEWLYQRTSLSHDRIMVFPQGEFSIETGQVLKHNNFVAAVNTSVAPSNGCQNETRVVDLWDVAIQCYGSFPIFTRRYLTHGIENFAFDMLLGKPCLLVAHHDGFKDDGCDLIGFIEKLNALPTKLVWRSLGQTVSRSVRIRKQNDGSSALQAYGNSVFVENSFAKPHRVDFIKQESDPECLGAVVADQEQIEWSWDADRLRFNVTIPAGESTTIRFVYNDKLAVGTRPQNVGYRVKAGLRRFLSETRDQYISQSSFLNKSAHQMRRLLR